MKLFHLLGSTTVLSCQFPRLIRLVITGENRSTISFAVGQWGIACSADEPEVIGKIYYVF